MKKYDKWIDFSIVLVFAANFSWFVVDAQWFLAALCLIVTVLFADLTYRGFTGKRLIPRRRR